MRRRLSVGSYSDDEHVVGHCCDCAFFHHERDLDQEMDKGTCRRFPPSCQYDFMAEADGECGYAATVWPSVDWTDWCGEFSHVVAWFSESFVGGGE